MRDRVAGGSHGLFRAVSVGPLAAIFLLLTVLPMLNLLVVSFFEITYSEARAHWRFVGLDHYTALSEDKFFLPGIVNTFMFVAAAVAVEMVLGLVLALAVSRLARGRMFYLTIFLLPILTPAIVIGAIFRLIYNADFGILNQALNYVGLPGQDWLNDPHLALASVIVLDIWHWTPFTFLFLLAGLESLPQELFEAADIDGASFLQRLRFVTLPLMWQVIVVTTLFRAFTAFKVFDEIFLLTKGGPGTSTEVVSFSIYRSYFTENRAGYASAMAVAITVLVVVMVLATLRANRHRLAQTA